MEGVEVAAGGFEGFDPFLRLWFPPLGSALLLEAFCAKLSERRGRERRESRHTHLGDHHMAIEGALPVRRCGALDVRPDLRHDGGAEGHVGHEVAVHDVDVKPTFRIERLASNL